jgi:hypothetical protein
METASGSSVSHKSQAVTRRERPFNASRWPASRVPPLRCWVLEQRAPTVLRHGRNCAWEAAVSRVRRCLAIVHVCVSRPSVSRHRPRQRLASVGVSTPLPSVSRLVLREHLAIVLGFRLCTEGREAQTDVAPPSSSPSSAPRPREPRCASVVSAPAVSAAPTRFFLTPPILSTIDLLS